VDQLNQLIKNKNMIFSEVRCDYLDPFTHKYHIDAWKTTNDDEEGRTIATVGTNGQVEWLIKNRLDKEQNANVFEAIEEAIKKQIENHEK
jgi:hypothetical protein